MKKRTYSTRRRVARRRVARRPALARPVRRYADAHSFRLSGQSMAIISTGAAGGPIAVGSGIGIGSPVQGGNGSSNSWWLGGAFGFSLDKTLQVSQLQTLFDRYKINGVKLTFYPEWNFNQVQGGAFLPQMKIVHDYDDNSYPTPGDVWARRGKIYRLDKPFSIFVRPKLVVGVAATGGGNIVQRAQYLDMANVVTPHFGIKFAIRDWYASGSSATVSNQTLRVEAEYFVTVKNQIRVGAPLPGLIELDENGVPQPGPGLAQTDQEDQPCEDK